MLMALCLPALADDAYGDGAQAFERKDYATARAAWLPLAKAGNARAQYGTGLLRSNGWGVAHDALRALHWYTVAAERGHPGAQYNLAVMHDKGDGVPRDAAQAAFWYGEAARQGLPEAAYNLALMTLAGDGLQRDPARAMAWLDRARASDRAQLIAALPEAQVSVSSANVRAMPTGAGHIVGHAPYGHGLRVFSRRGGWAEVRLAGVEGAPDKVGWIAARLLDGLPAPGASPVRLERFEFGPLTGLHARRARRAHEQPAVAMTTRATARARGPRDGDRLLRNSGWLAGLDRVNFGNGNGNAASGDDSHDTMRVATDMLNVRAGPTTDAAVIARLADGDSVRVIGRRSGWRRIQLPEGPGSGWVASFLLAGDGPLNDVENPGRAVRIGASQVNVRAGPTTEARVLGTLGRGASARVINSQGGWRELRIPGKPGRGWVAAFLIAGEVVEPRGERAARVGQSGG